jgi:hypothetical protein
MNKTWAEIGKLYDPPKAEQPPQVPPKATESPTTKEQGKGKVKHGKNTP